MSSNRLTFDDLNGSEDLVYVDGVRYAVDKAGRSIAIGELSYDQYWAYLSMREHSWYRDEVGNPDI